MQEWLIVRRQLQLDTRIPCICIHLPCAFEILVCASPRGWSVRAQCTQDPPGSEPSSDPWGGKQSLTLHESSVSRRGRSMLCCERAQTLAVARIREYFSRVPRSDLDHSTQSGRLYVWRTMCKRFRPAEGCTADVAGST